MFAYQFVSCFGKAPMNRPTLHSRRPAHGFSLLELMLVIAIIAVLTAVVAVNVGTQGARAKKRATITSMEVIKNILAQYNMDYSAYPPTLSVLVSLKLFDSTKPFKDAWGTDFFYNPIGLGENAYQFMSLGDDKTSGTPDDIDVWTMMKQ